VEEGSFLFKSFPKGKGKEKKYKRKKCREHGGYNNFPGK